MLLPNRNTRDRIEVFWFAKDSCTGLDKILTPTPVAGVRRRNWQPLQSLVKAFEELLAERKHFLTTLGFTIYLAAYVKEEYMNGESARLRYLFCY